jgi:hypothetical protein
MKQVDELIRGEMSAIKSIDAILNKINDASEKSELSTIRQDHIKAVDRLKTFAPRELREEAQSSGPWGAFASAFTGGASFFGDKAALNALKVGEQHGLNEYREYLKDGNADPEVSRLIQSELLPNQERHLQTIDRYLQ